jgi:hypothetical protein
MLKKAGTAGGTVTATPLNWITATIGASQVPDSPVPAPDPFRVVCPQIKFNMKEYAKTKFVCRDAERNNDLREEGKSERKFFLEGPDFKLDTLTIVPITTYNRHEMWENSKCVYENPTMFGPLPDAPEGGQDALRVVLYEVNMKSFYSLDLKNSNAINEGKFLQWQMAKDVHAGLNPWSFTYTLFTYKKENRFGGENYYVRIRREDDEYKSAVKNKLSPDNYKLGPVFDRIATNSEVYEMIYTAILANPPSRESAAIHMLGLTGTQAAMLMKKLEYGDLTLTDVMATLPEVKNTTQT